MLDELRTFKPFRSLDRTTLAAVERCADRLRLPAQRLLRRRGQSLARELYLVEGVVAVRRKTGVQRLTARATEGESLNSLAADDEEISTVTQVEVIAVDPDPVRHLLAGDAEATVAPSVGLVEDWVHALLQGPVLRWFPPSVWARVLRTGSMSRLQEGERVFSRGETPDRVFVVAEGMVAAGEEHLGPGEFFGEEAALMRCPAMYDATMATDGTVVSFPRDDILDLVDDYDAPRAEPPRRLDLDDVPVSAEEDVLTGLDQSVPVAVRGADGARRLVVAAKLMRRGFTVV